MRGMFVSDTIELRGADRLRPSAWPHWHSGFGITPMLRAQLLAAVFPLAGGAILFGWQAVRVLAIAAAVALLCESLFSILARRSRLWSETQVLVIAALLTCTLPPDVPWSVPAMGAAIAVLIGQALPGGIGNYLWNPVALGRVAVQLLFADAVTRQAWPVLAPARLLWGDLMRSAPLPPLGSWSGSALPDGVNAWSLSRTVDVLTTPLPAAKGGASQALAHLVRDVLPPWQDSLLGVAGGAIGEACAVAVLAAGLVLMWKGILRWQLAAGAILAAVAGAAILPVYLTGEGGRAAACWLPGAAIWNGIPVGLVYMCYQLTGGGLLLVIMILACDTTSSPLTSRGHAVFGVLIGGGTIALRTLVGLPAAEYWALLLANTAVPVINRFTRRRVLGT